MAVDKSRFPRSVLEVYCNNALRRGALTAMLNYYRAMFRYAQRGDPRLRQVLEVPTLMIWGERDTALGIELTYGTEALVRDFSLHYLPGVSHWVQQEAPEAVNAIMMQWLSTHGP
jgi:pimeloyl-ACP methyl ester carboxylesterase